MLPISVHQDLLNQYTLSMLLRGIFTPANQQSIQLMHRQNDVDIIALLSILLTRYPNSQTMVPKLGNLHLAWDFAQNPVHHDWFINMLQVSPLLFQTILTLIEEHPIFTNGSNNGQTPVKWVKNGQEWRSTSKRSCKTIWPDMSHFKSPYCCGCGGVLTIGCYSITVYHIFIFLTTTGQFKTLSTGKAEKKKIQTF